MTRLPSLSFCRVLLLAALLLSRGPIHAADSGPRIDFNRDVRPILADKCFACHGPDAAHRKADLRLDTEEGSRTAGAVVPGKPQDSELIDRVSRRSPSGRMPPVKSGKALSPREIDLLRRWIEQGATYAQHWSFAPPRRPVAPAVKTAVGGGAIDRFLLARIEAAGLRFSPSADKITLLRRLSFDLTGLPPTSAAVDAFLADARPAAYERLVDRLLASPAYGERMAVYWLDLVRYADTVGYHGDQEHPSSPYRDYVIDAFNHNLPFDRFTVEQLAGDLLPRSTVDQKIASGYNRLLQTTHEGGAQDGEYRAKYAADRVRNVSGVWMGATMGCAECHDHKFDPYGQKDFYRLAAFFADVDELGAFRGPDATPTKRPPELAVLSPLDRLEAERLDKLLGRKTAELTALAGRQDEEAKAQTTRVRREVADLQQQRQAVEKRKRLMMITVSVKPRTVRVLKRGDWMDASGEVVEPGAPQFLKPLDVKGRRATRLDLARWLTAPDHPQTARVFVNRLWQLFFGAGLSRTPEDNGAQGQWPTHPELLDFLAVEFIDSGWDVKHVVRLLVTSTAYRQSSIEPEHLHRLDPENRLFARQARFRLPAEMIRDNVLAASGLLVRQVGGPSARPYQPTGYYDYLNFPKRTYKADAGAGQHRRGVYTHWQRQFLHPMLKAFDAPSREECTAQRPVSNTPLQALTLLNDPSFVEAARVLAGRILREGGDSPEERIRWAWRTVLSRPPLDREATALARLVRLSRAQYRAQPDEARKLLKVGLTGLSEGDAVELAVWTAVARVLLNLDETITRS